MWSCLFSAYFPVNSPFELPSITSIDLPTCFLLIYLPISYSSTCLFIYLLIHLPICESTNQSIYLSFYLSIYLSIYDSSRICLFLFYFLFSLSCSLQSGPLSGLILYFSACPYPGRFSMLPADLLPDLLQRFCQMMRLASRMTSSRGRFASSSYTFVASSTSPVPRDVLLSMVPVPCTGFTRFTV